MSLWRDRAWQLWRTHSSVPCRDSSRHGLHRRTPGVGSSADAARKSACATGAVGRRKRLPHIILAALALAAVLGAQELVIPVKVNLVHIVATVKNRAGQLVGSLAKEDFDIFDNGVRQEVAIFERQTNQPLSVALLVDVSGSTNQDLKFETESAVRFIRSLISSRNSEDQVALYTFDDAVTQVHNYTRNIASLEGTLRGMHGSAGTSLYDAIWLASRDIELREGRKALVLVSDGGETTSTIDSHRALEAAQLADAVIYGVIVMPITNDAGRNIGGEHALQFMAEGTGGRTFLLSEGAQLDRAFNSIITELRTEYLLGYYPHDVPLTKERFHKLELRMKSPELRASARNGYYGEAEASAGPAAEPITLKPDSRKKR
jgi:Ca-activated chloride channel family protein